ncbi:hypothetical protein [Clostridium estertheticum]|nr:hypothetical protein [Clostridium estertheticum]
MVVIKHSILDDCKNLKVSHGAICIQCNKCKRFDKKEIKYESEEI